MKLQITILVLILCFSSCKEKTEKKFESEKEKTELKVENLNYKLTNYSGKDLESKLSNYAKNLNKYTPIQIDKYSILDSVTSIKNKAYLEFHHTLINKNISEVNYDSLHKYIRSIIIEDIENPEFKIFNENKISIDYKYYGENGRLITLLSVTNKPENKNHD